MRLSVLFLAVCVVACASAQSTTPAVDASVADTSKARDPNANCVKPGTANNEVGVGGYCEPGTDQCVSDAGIRFCTGAFGAPSDHWFCTRPCVMDLECGSGAYCDHDPQGNGCVPNICGTPPDGGTKDAAPSDAKTD